MRTVSEVYRSARNREGWQRLLAVLAITASLCTGAGAQIDVSETGLHDRGSVYGFHAPSNPIPYVNLDAITLLAWGAADPHPYTDVSFYAYGLFIDVNVVNSGAIAVTGTGGTADVDHLDAPADASSFAYSLYSIYGLVTNSGQIDVTAWGGTATGQDAGAASAQAEVAGIYVWGNIEVEPSVIQNTGAIVATAVGGAADSASADARADATARGLQGSYTDVSSTADLAVTARGGAASAHGVADVRANASGVFVQNGGEMNVGGNVAVTAIGGTADANDRANIYADAFANAFADATAHGLYVPHDYAYPNSISNGAVLAVTAVGGTAHANTTFDGATASGIFALTQTQAVAGGIYGAEEDVTNTGNIEAIGRGGTAEAQIYVDIQDSVTTYATAYAFAGIRGIETAGGVDNSGDIAVTGIGGIARTASSVDVGSTPMAEADVRVSSHAAAGIYGIYAGHDVNNTGDIKGIATGGTAQASASAFTEAQGDASASANVYGIWSSEGSVVNTGVIETTATGGTADADATVGDAHISAAANAVAYGIYAQQNATSSGAVTVTALGGTADSGSVDPLYAFAYAYGEAYGLQAVTGIRNTGAITANASGGTADADASAHAYGLKAVGSIDNAGPVGATATGGTAGVYDIADANAYAYAIYGENAVINHGALTVVSTGGTADNNNVDARARASGYAYGIYSAYGLIANDGQIDATASGGTALSGDVDFMKPHTIAAGRAYGLYAGDGGIENSAAVNATATGGNVTGTAVDAYHDILASGWAYGLLLDYDAAPTYTERHVSNSGNLTIAAVGGSAQGPVYRADASAWTYGIKSARAPITNSGAILAAATGGNALSTYGDTRDMPAAHADAVAYGIEADTGPRDDGGGGAGTGDGVIIVTPGIGGVSGSDEVQGIAGSRESLARGLMAEAQTTLQNHGTLTATARGGTATGRGAADASASAEAHGFFVEGEGFVWDPREQVPTSVQNQAAISVTARGGAAESVSGDATAEAQAFGLTTYYADVSNSGDLTVTAQGGNSSAGADAVATAAVSGLYVSSGNVNNSGRITVAATAGTGTAGAEAMAYAPAGAIGIAVGPASLTNSGDITASARGGSVAGGRDVYTDAYAMGIQAAASTINNSGDITVSAHGGSTTGGRNLHTDGHAIGIQMLGATVDNSGNITAAATAAPGSHAYAYGISSEGDNTLTNTGIIRATGDTAFELYVSDHTTTLLDTYNVTLDGDPQQASIGIANGARLVLNHATLSATAVSGETLWNTDYKLFETQGTGVVDGNFAEVRAANPNTTATYHDQDTPGSADDTVSLAYTPFGSPALASAAVEKQAISQAADVVNHHMTATLLQRIVSPPAGLLADAGSTAESLALAEAASDKSRGVFVEPYYSLLDRDANPLGYHARLWGFSAGYERFLDNTLLGLHLGYGQSDIEYTGAGYRGNNEDQDVVTGGFSGLTRWDPWTLRYGLTGFYGRHDYEGLTGLSLTERETASYNSYGTATTLMAGHVFRYGSHVLLPEAGLNWLWTHRERYTTEAMDPSWDTTYSALNDNDLYAAVALQWLSSFWYGKVRVTPSASVGIRHLLTDAQAGVWQSIPGAAPVLVRSEQDRTAMTLSGALVLTRTPHAASLAYDGDYAPDARRHSIWLRYSWLF